MPSVLLLDDNDDFRHVLKELLETLGYDVCAFDNGQAALNYLAAPGSAVDIILCDIHMPDMDGFTFLRHVRENPALAHICIIAASGSREDRPQALAEGANAYVVKPFNVRDLVALLEKCPPAPAPTPVAQPAAHADPPTVRPEEETREAKAVRIEDDIPNGQADSDD